MLECRIFENIWMIYSTSLLAFFLLDIEQLEIPLNISDRIQRNNFFTLQFSQLEPSFTSFWSNHSMKMNCGDQCSKALVIDGFQKPDRHVCQFVQSTIHSEELGNL